MKITAETRTVVKPNHAMITPDGYVNSVVPGWSDCEINVIINPAMGAQFSQQLIHLDAEGKGEAKTEFSEIFLYVVHGHCEISVEGKTHDMSQGNFLYIPPGNDYRVTNNTSLTQILTFQKEYEPLEDYPVPQSVFGNRAKVPSELYMEDPQLHMQNLLPDELSFDMAVNIFTYDPGGNLPFVETHIMEHGLLYLAGQGIYMLDDNWYPIQKGDSLWMAPYCPQWFVAMGKEPAVYIYYKNVNRYAIKQ